MAAMTYDYQFTNATVWIDGEHLASNATGTVTLTADDFPSPFGEYLRYSKAQAELEAALILILATIRPPNWDLIPVSRDNCPYLTALQANPRSRTPVTASRSARGPPHIPGRL